MGMYTGLRVVAKIKPEYRGLVDSVVEYSSTHGCAPLGCWLDVVDQYPFTQQFAEMDRSSFIPYGSLNYMPYEWEKTNEWDNITWSFCCSLKNYEGEIETFIDTILVVIAEYAEVEYLYEEMTTPHKYVVEGGELIQIQTGKYEWEI